MLLPTATLLASLPGRAPTEPAASGLEQPRYEREGRAQVYNNHSASDMSPIERCVLTQKRCTVAAIRSCVEWEPETFPLLPTIIGKPVVPLGLLPPSPEGARRAASADREHATLRWLDAQPPSFDAATIAAR